MNYEDEPEALSSAMEIRSTPENKVGAAFLMLLLCSMGVFCWASAIWPQIVESRPHNLPASYRVFLFFFSSGPFGFGLFWSQVWFYRLRADAHGITESTGFRGKRVFWSDVASYSLEPNHDQARSMEPVLRDAQGAVIFRAAGIARGSDKASLARRAEFARFVQLHLEGKRAP